MKLKEPENKNYAALKVCPSCRVEKDTSGFTKTSRTKSGYQSWCKKCTQKQTLARHHRLMASDPEYKEKRRKRSLESRYKYKYGITLEDKINMLNLQESMCAMCGISLVYETGVLDHNHATGKVRSILCIKCNTGLSYIEDNNFLNRAKEYLNEHKA